ncbi:MAG TPA: redoxin family protein [Terriglobales bacterium]
MVLRRSILAGVVLNLLMAAGYAQTDSQKLLKSGDQMLQEQKFEDAYKVFEKANKIAGEKCSECLLKMSLTKLQMGDEGAAMKLASKSLIAAGSPHEKSEADGMKGEILLSFAGDNQKKLAAAEQAFREALKDYPEAVIFHVKVGIALVKQNKDDEGKAELKAYLAANPNGSNAEIVKKWIEDTRRLKFAFAPEFTLTTSRGEVLKSSELTGKVVLIDFWATWCPPCRESVPELKDLATKYPPDKFVQISVSADDDHDKWKQFIADKKMTWTQYFDADKHMLDLFNVHAFPTYILIDREGIIRERVSGLNPQQTVGSRMKEPLKKIMN